MCCVHPDEPAGWLMIAEILVRQARFETALPHTRVAHVVGAEKAEVRGLLLRIKAGLGERDPDGVLRVDLGGL